MSRYLISRGIGQRRLIGQIAVGQGIAYWLIVLLNRPLTTTYQRQIEIAPLWVWGTLLLTLGGLFWWTAYQYRHRMFGRFVAAAMLGLQVWFAVTFAMAGALTAIGQYIPIVLVVFLEAVFVNSGEG
jgi:predicted MFS family arabinose efflux permease